MKVYGPYLSKTGSNQGRKSVIIIYDDGTRRSLLLSRYIMETKLGHKLNPNEHVDHIDEDKTNDNENNLQILSQAENNKKSIKINRPCKLYTFNCPICDKLTNKVLAQVKHNWKLGKSGPYCSKQCARKAQMVKQENTKVSKTFAN